MKPQLSIIVPVYNVEQYLQKCVESILNQTYKDYELILVDDGSTDLSPKLCDEWTLRDTRIRTVHRENGGLSCARNTGLSIATGNYVTFVDSDDWIDCGMYETMIRALIENNADIVICGHRVVTPDGKIEETVVFDEPTLMTGLDATIEILKDEKIPSFAWNKVFKIHLFKDVKFPEGRIYEDTAVIYRYFDIAQKVCIVNKAFYNYLRRPGSICLSSNDDVERTIKKRYDNAQAFYERYVFVRGRSTYATILTLCAEKCVSHIVGFLHFCAKVKVDFESSYLQHAFSMFADVDIPTTISNYPRISMEQSLARKGYLYYSLLKMYY